MNNHCLTILIHTFHLTCFIMSSGASAFVFIGFISILQSNSNSNKAVRDMYLFNTVFLTSCIIMVRASLFV